jgi:hypothetical protein
MSADTLLSRLDRVRQTGADRWISRCPAHDDKGPSLSIRQTPERILIYCFAGCSAEDVLDAVGLRWTDLYPDLWTAANRGAAANPGRKWMDQFARRWNVDQLAVERRIIALAAEQIQRGEPLSIDDQVRVEIAAERLEAAGGDAA